jgi:prepilin-type N-terminal cleavage/methylation domain-containing protein
MKRTLAPTKGVTLIELLIVVAIIMILAVISLPNIFKIIMMHRVRTSANDVFIKARFIRSLAIQSRRELVWAIDKGEQSFTIISLGHTEYDLLQDIADAVSKGKTLDPADSAADEYILYAEKGGQMCNTKWNNALVPDSTCEYYFGGSRNKNGIDADIVIEPSSCGSEVKFYPSGTLQSTCQITIKNEMLDRQYTILLYKGGQIAIK